MNQVAMLSNPDSGTASHRSTARPLAAAIGAPWILAAFFAVVLCVWHSFDHRLPGTDEAGHILNALQYKDLWHHPHFFRADWWHQFLTVNQFYPPALYAFNGLLKLLFGTARWVDTLSLAFFSVLLTSCTYGITRMVSRSVAAAVVAAVTVNLYPELAWLSHYYMLDYPLVATVAAALWTMLWWNERPSWPRACAAAFTVAFACMSKQVVAAYLLLPGVWCLWQATRSDFRSERAADVPPLRLRVAQILLIPTAVLAAAIPWFTANWQWIHSYSQENIRAMQLSGAMTPPAAALLEYSDGLIHSMSPLLFFAFVCGLLFTKADTHRRLIPVYFSALGGIVALSLLSWQPPLDRYVASCLICSAVVTGCGAARVLDFGAGGRAPVIALLLLASAQFISFSFCGYPISTPSWLVSSASCFGVALREYRGARIFYNAPMRPDVDWGQEWVVQQVKAVDGLAPVWLNILPSDSSYNPHTFELLAKETGAAVRPTTTRLWTITGDQVGFDPKTAMYYHWYLLKTGDQGNRFCDKQSEVNYAQLIDFVQHSGHFRLVAERPAPHGATLQLYRQTP